MNNRHPSHYFSVGGDFHPELFAGVEQVWEILDRLLDYLERLPLGQKEVTVPDGVILDNPEQITLCEGVVVEPGAYLRGPCHIGPYTTIRHGAYLRGGVITGEHSVIGHATEVKNSLFLDHAHAAHFAYVGDSILGARVNLGAGTRLANLRLDQKEVFFHDSEESIATGRRKLGAILGEDVQVGCNAVLNPGTFMGMGASVYPCVNVGGYVESNGCMKTHRYEQVQR